MSLKLLMRHNGGGMFECATAIDRRNAIEHCESGVSCWHTITLPRSVKQNKWLHAVVEKAWAQQRGTRWESPAHLMAYAFCAVGHKKANQIQLPASISALDRLLFEEFICAVIRANNSKNRYSFVKRHGDTLMVETPLPWAFDSLERDEANKVTDAVAAFLVSDDGPCPGVTVEQLFEAVEDPT